MSAQVRIGTGVDAHAFDITDDAGPGSPLRLAGLDWPGERRLAGHSDGDVVCHAIVDALLSAASLGGIGELVGVDEPEVEGAASTGFVTRSVERLVAAGWQPVNVSVQLVGNRPKFTPRRDEAERLLSEIVGAPVSVGATTSDGMGFTGRGEGIAAIATALIERS